MEPVALRPLRVGEILDVAIKLYRNNFGTLVRIVLFVTVPTQILVALLRASTPSDFENTSTTFGSTTVDSTNVDGGKLAAYAVGIALVSIIGLIMGEIASAGCFRAIGGAYLGEEQTWQGSLRYALKRLRSLLWLTIIKNFVIACGLILCVIPGIWLYGAFAVTTPALMLEGVRGRKALRRSRDLVKGRWWPVAGVLLIGTLLTSIVGGAIGALASGVFFANNDPAVDVARAFGSIIGSTLTTPVLAAIVTVLYIDLRVRKEGFDLELLADTVGVDPTGT
ncbi:MAG: hypothetical protein H0U92_12720, partial [Actinobacteria bacterium]|nr:hypothetical protein [Actinomycetota bacterium]